LGAGKRYDHWRDGMTFAEARRAIDLLAAREGWGRDD
jgi:hypothetical protein